MCTVVVRWSADHPARVLALRDELTTRPFDDPGAWWPEQPDVIGGRDQVAGGSWCVTDVRTAVTALVLNRPERRVATAGAPSRGVLPLLAVEHRMAWQEHLEVAGMASFTLVLVEPDALTCWDFDGTTLTAHRPPRGTHMFTSGGAEDGKAERFLPVFTAREDWLEVVHGQLPADDPTALVVRHERDGLVFGTVFGQLLVARPGSLDLAYSRTPWRPGWITR